MRDAIANVAIIGAAGATLLTHSIWPDIVVGCAIAWMNIDAAREVLAAARGEKAMEALKPKVRHGCRFRNSPYNRIALA
ncbi:hypothetical protein BH10PSE4_BH10PSE4_41520 [soil metagenome]